MCLKLSKATSTVQHCVVDKSDKTLHFVRRQKKIKLRTGKGKGKKTEHQETLITDTKEYK